MPIDDFIAMLEQLRDENPDAYVYNIDGNSPYPELDDDRNVIV